MRTSEVTTRRARSSRMVMVSGVAVSVLLLPLGCGSTPTDTNSNRPRIVSGVAEESIEALKQQNELLRDELVSVRKTLAEARKVRKQDREATNQALSELQAQVGGILQRFHVVMQAQDESVKNAERNLQDLNRSVKQQGNILKELAKRSKQRRPDPRPAPPVAVTPPKTPPPVVAKEAPPEPPAPAASPDPPVAPAVAVAPPPKTSPSPVVSERPLPSVLPTVDLNTVSAAALVRGLLLTRQQAEAIIKHRPYKRIGELVSMNVIPKETFDRVRKQLVIANPAK